MNVTPSTGTNLLDVTIDTDLNMVDSSGNIVEDTDSITAEQYYADKGIDVNSEDFNSADSNSGNTMIPQTTVPTMVLMTDHMMTVHMTTVPMMMDHMMTVPMMTTATTTPATMAAKNNQPGKNYITHSICSVALQP